MVRLDDLDATTASLEASFDGIRAVMDGLAHRTAAAEQARDAAIAQSAESVEDLARYNALCDRLIELAHKAQAMMQTPG